MKIVPIAEVKAKFSAYVKRCEHEPVVVTRNGRPVAMLVSVNEDDIERAILAHNPEFQQLLSAARARIQTGEGIPAEEFWRELEVEETS